MSHSHPRQLADGPLPITTYLPAAGLLLLEVIGTLSMLAVVSAPQRTVILVFSGCYILFTAYMAADMYRQAKAQQRRSTTSEAALERFAHHLLPQAVTRVQQGENTDTVAESVRPPASCGPAYSRLLSNLVSTVLQATAGRYQVQRAYQQLDQQLKAWEFAIEGLARHVLPQAVARVQQGEDVDEVAASLGPPVDAGPAYARLHTALVSRVLQAEERASGAPESVRRAFTAMGQRMQEAHNQGLSRLQELQEEHHEDQLIFGILQDLDHQWSRSARLTDSIVILGGGRPGRRWRTPKSLHDVLLGAMSRIIDYKGVRLEGIPRVGVSGQAREELQHILAELLENATTFTPPGQQVAVRASRGPAGVLIEIDDEGLGLTSESASRIQRLITGGADISLEEIGEHPHVGLIVSTRLAQRFDIQLQVSPNMRGGARASVLLPPSIVTEAPEPSTVTEAPEPTHSPAMAPPVERPALAPEPDASASQVRRTQGGLPVRGARTTDTPREPQNTPPADGPTVTPESRAGALSAIATHHLAQHGEPQPPKEGS